jgi:streptogramin lyase
VNDNLLLISQQTDGSLVKVVLDDNGRPTGSSKWQLTTPFSGLVLGDSGSNVTVWATAQFDNVILRVILGENDINSAPTVASTIRIPSPASGPHGILVNNGNLWIACKDSSHLVRISIADTSDTNVYPVSGRPIFVAVHPTSNDVYASLDLSSKIWHLKSGGVAEEIDVPPSVGNTPVGLLAGPDGNAWVALLGNSTTGTGTFGRINSDASIDWFDLASKVGQNAGLIHIAFDTNSSRFWLLGSSTVDASAPNAVFTVSIDTSTQGSPTGPRIAIQNTMMLPTQWSWTHRIVSHGGSLYVTELTTSTLAHISGAVVNGWPVSET